MSSQIASCTPSFEPSRFTKVQASLTHLGSLAALSAIAATTYKIYNTQTSLAFAIPLIVTAGLLAYTIHHLALKVISGGDVLRSAVFVSADKLSTDLVRGGLPNITLPPMIAALEGCSSARARLLAMSLKALLEHQKCANLLLGPHKRLSLDYLDYLLKIKPSELFVFPLQSMSVPFGQSSGSHILAGSLENIDGALCVRIYNAGQGMNHHPQISFAMHQSCVEKTGVSLESFRTFFMKVAPLQMMGFNHQTKLIYDAFSEMEGNLSSLSPDLRLRERPQSGLSCSGYSFRCLIRGTLSDEEFSEFEKTFLRQVCGKLFSDYTKGPFYKSTQEHLFAYNNLTKRLAQLDPLYSHRSLTQKKSLLSSLASLFQSVFWDIYSPRVEARSYSDISYHQLHHFKSSLIYKLESSRDVERFYENIQFIHGRYFSSSVLENLLKNTTQVLSLVNKALGHSHRKGQFLARQKASLELLREHLELYLVQSRGSSASIDHIKSDISLFDQEDKEILQAILFELEPKSAVGIVFDQMFSALIAGRIKEARSLLCDIYTQKDPLSYLDFASCWTKSLKLKASSDLDTLDVYTGLASLGDKFSHTDIGLLNLNPDVLKQAQSTSSRLALNMMFDSPWYEISSTQA